MSVCRLCEISRVIKCALKWETELKCWIVLEVWFVFLQGSRPPFDIACLSLPANCFMEIFLRKCSGLLSQLDRKTPTLESSIYVCKGHASACR